MGVVAGEVRKSTPHSSSRLRVLADTADRVAPVVLAGDRRFQVSSALTHVLPEGLQRGSTLGVRGPASMSLALAIAAGPVASGSWLAIIGGEELGLVGAEQAGVALHRVVMVSQPPRSSLGAVAAALVDAFDMVLVASSHPIRARDARRLLSRTKERGGVIIDSSGSWPEAQDIMLEVVDQRWSGLGVGHGVLKDRKVTVDVSGRRGVRPRRVPLWLPGPQVAPEAIEPGTHAGADIERLVEVDEEVIAPLRRVV